MGSKFGLIERWKKYTMRSINLSFLPWGHEARSNSRCCVAFDVRTGIWVQTNHSTRAAAMESRVVSNVVPAGWIQHLTGSWQADYRKFNQAHESLGSLFESVSFISLSLSLFFARDGCRTWLSGNDFLNLGSKNGAFPKILGPGIGKWDWKMDSWFLGTATPTMIQLDLNFAADLND